MATKYIFPVPVPPPVPVLPPPFGERLAAVRSTLGLSQADLATKLGITREMINYYERRAQNPTADFIQKAAKALGVSGDELLGVKPVVPRKPGPPSKLQQKLELIRKLPPSKQQAIMQVLDMALKSVAL